MRRPFDTYLLEQAAIASPYTSHKSENKINLVMQIDLGSFSLTNFSNRHGVRKRRPLFSLFFQTP